MSLEVFSENKDMFRLSIERDAITNEYQTHFNHNGHAYKYICEANDTDCYYIRDDGMVCRYYYNHGYDSRMVKIKILKTSSGYLCVKFNEDIHLISDLIIEYWLPNISESSYKITA